MFGKTKKAESAKADEDASKKTDGRILLYSRLRSNPSSARKASRFSGILRLAATSSPELVWPPRQPCFLAAARACFPLKIVVQYWAI